MKSDDYIPIACALHDEYEIAIMRNERLHITWRDTDDRTHTAYVLAEDILVKNREEFLLTSDEDGNKACIRLDKISSLD